MPGTIQKGERKGDNTKGENGKAAIEDYRSRKGTEGAMPRTIQRAVIGGSRRVRQSRRDEAEGGGGGGEGGGGGAD